MKKIILAGLAGIFLLVGSTRADFDPYRITAYTYFTDVEVTRFDEIIWFWNTDTLYGRIRSNDIISFRGEPRNFEIIYSASGIVWNGGSRGPNCPPLPLPRSYPHLVDLATDSYHSNNGRLLTHIIFNCDEGADVWQYPAGDPDSRELVDEFDLRDDRIVYVDGQLDVEGIVDGRVTLYARGDIGLTNDLRYASANRLTGDFDENSINEMLGVVSDGNILIRNTLANGKDNGLQVERNNWDRHSIVLNGSYIALGSEFTFEHQNDEWERYQGPEPDERGYIYLKGGIAQQRRGYVHRANHDGTGYSKAYRWDFRLELTAPPGLMREDDPHLEYEFERLTVKGGVKYLDGVTIDKLYIEPGSTFHLEAGNALTVRDTLVAQGSADRPIRFIADEPSRITIAGGARSSRMSFVSVEGPVEFIVENGDFSVSNCAFDGTVSSAGRSVMDSCLFKQALTLTGSGIQRIDRSVFRQGVASTNRQGSLELTHCTVIGGRNSGVSVEGGEAFLTNSIVAYSRDGVVVERNGDATIRYCDVFDNGRDFIDCVPGQGTFSADPQFADLRSSDFSLTENSPCIDAGDPTSLRDPDGTVADLGAFWLDRGLGIGDGEDNPPYPPFNRRGGLPLEGLTASPNPFNATTVIRFEGSPINREATVRIFDLAGREVFSQAVNPLRLTAETESVSHRGLISSTETVTWDASAYPAGIYVVRVENGSEIATLKLVLVR